MIFNIPKDVEFIINAFYQNGYEAFIVGGCIRDLLLNKPPLDYDIATSAPPDVTEKLFSKTIPTGIKHGTVTVIINSTSYEVTTYRTEGKYLNNRFPEDVVFINDIKGDLARRDFTINSFAYNKKEGLLDFFNGIHDLKNKSIKCVGNPNNRFSEDALRILRAIRFSAQLDFDIESKTFSSIKANYNLINNISKERTRDEFKKILLCDNPIKGLNYLIQTNIWNIIFSQLNQNIILNNNIGLLPKDICIRLSGLFHYYNNDKIKLTLQDLRFSNYEINRTYNFISNYKYLKNEISKLEVRKIISIVGREDIFDLINMYEVLEETSLTNFKKHAHSIIKNNDPLYINDLNINGSILKSNFNFKSGKLIGEVLKHLLDLVMKESIDNTTSSLLNEAEKYILQKGAVSR